METAGVGDTGAWNTCSGKLQAASTAALGKAVYTHHWQAHRGTMPEAFGVHISLLWALGAEDGAMGRNDFLVELKFCFHLILFFNPSFEMGMFPPCHCVLKVFNFLMIHYSGSQLRG